MTTTADRSMAAHTDRIVLVLGCLLVLALVNSLIARKEYVAATGIDIYLALAPIDPRSILQGDYMTLRFDLANQIQSSEAQTDEDGAASEGEVAYAPITLDERQVAELAEPGSTLRIRYRWRGQQVWLGTNAFFFQEGDAQRYEKARFGHFKLSRSSGDAVLIGLTDDALQPL